LPLLMEVNDEVDGLSLLVVEEDSGKRDVKL
jgi:hypothetical protein